MTVREWLASKYSSLGVAGFEAELEGVIASGSLDPNATLDSSTLQSVERAFVKRIPELLLRPTSISELGVSISRASDEAIRNYYNIKCRELGLPNELGQRPKVTFY